MPCFKGIAVSVHSEGAPLPEYGLQKISRSSRVNAYIPVPKAASQDVTQPEPSKFAISITLLTPDLPIPYSTPKPTAADPNPQPQRVADMPGLPGSRPNRGASINPYIPITKSSNETIAAYIYFDGRGKEEVATLLRPGEETWVNSRWVQIPELEGGGLAEREFLFREVGLERWLNGLDLDGQDAAAKIEKRRLKFEKQRRIKREQSASDDELDSGPRKSSAHVLRYGDFDTPVEKMEDEEEYGSDSEDDEMPEAAGQIKVAMFRVLASGEIKRGEYSPQFDAHENDEEMANKDNGNDADGADVDHTTSFAAPKTLDPKTISTQTVTGIDGPEKPFAVFTFLYRGERECPVSIVCSTSANCLTGQLSKMGLLPNSKQAALGTGPTKRRSGAGIDFSTLGALKPTGTVGYTAFRDNGETSRKAKARKKNRNGFGEEKDDDSDDDEDDDDADIVHRMEDVDDKEVKTSLTEEEAKFSEEMAQGVDRIKVSS